MILLNSEFHSRKYLSSYDINKKNLILNNVTSFQSVCYKAYISPLPLLLFLEMQHKY